MVRKDQSLYFRSKIKKPKIVGRHMWTVPSLTTHWTKGNGLCSALLKVLISSHFHVILYREYPDLELDTGGLSLPPLVNTGEVTQSLKMSWNVIKMSWKCQENVMKRSWKYHENFRSRDKYWPMRGQYSGHITSIDQSEASIDQSEGSIDQSEASFHLFASPGGL